MNHCRDCAAFVRPQAPHPGSCHRRAPMQNGGWPVAQESDGCLDFVPTDALLRRIKESVDICIREEKSFDFEDRDRITVNLHNAVMELL